MKLRQLRPGLWITELSLADFDVRGAVIVGETRMLVWDTLSKPRDMQQVAELVGSKPVDVVYSHADWDHCWGTAALKPDTIIAHERCAERFRSGEVAKRLAEKQAQEPDQWDTVAVLPPTMTFAQSLTLDLGGLTVELHALPGHTTDCIVAWIPQWRVLLAGDTIETPLPYLNAESVAFLPQWISALETWNANDQIRVVVPSHGAVGDRALISHNIDYLRALQTAQPWEIPAESTRFYVDTHAKNQSLVQASLR